MDENKIVDILEEQYKLYPEDNGSDIDAEENDESVNKTEENNDTDDDKQIPKNAEGESENRMD